MVTVSDVCFTPLTSMTNTPKVVANTLDLFHILIANSLEQTIEINGWIRCIFRSILEVIAAWKRTQESIGQ